MASFLTKKLSPFHQTPTPHLRLSLLPLLRLSTEATQPKNPPFISQYLISSYGFSPDRALRVAISPSLSRIKSPDRPEAVLRFLRETGLTDSQIKKLISWNPTMLAQSVAKTLQPRARELIDRGFTAETLIQLILLTPVLLFLKSAVSRLQFWRNFIGSDAAMLKIIRRNRRLLQSDIDEVVVPNIELLRRYGFTDAQIQRVFLSVGDTLKEPDSVKRLLEETEELGFTRQSGMFLCALAAVGRLNKDSIVRKLEILRKIYGLSEEESTAMFKKFPTIIGLSAKNLESKRDFLLGKVGLVKEDVISQPKLLGFSLEGRLMPRHYVLSVLKLKGLKTNTSFSGALSLSEKEFLAKFVVPYITEVPELEEVYSASCLRNTCN